MAKPHPRTYSARLVDESKAHARILWGKGLAGVEEEDEDDDGGGKE